MDKSNSYIIVYCSGLLLSFTTDTHSGYYNRYVHVLSDECSAYYSKFVLNILYVAKLCIFMLIL